MRSKIFNTEHVILKRLGFFLRGGGLVLACSFFSVFSRITDENAIFTNGEAIERKPAVRRRRCALRARGAGPGDDNGRTVRGDNSLSTFIVKYNNIRLHRFTVPYCIRIITPQTNGIRYCVLRRPICCRC